MSYVSAQSQLYFLLRAFRISICEPLCKGNMETLMLMEEFWKRQSYVRPALWVPYVRGSKGICIPAIATISLVETRQLHVICACTKAAGRGFGHILPQCKSFNLHNLLVQRTQSTLRTHREGLPPPIFTC